MIGVESGGQSLHCDNTGHTVAIFRSARNSLPYPEVFNES
jgi:hypothetical protein